MSWRILHISKAARLSVKNSQLLYQYGDEETLTVPLEDIAVIVIESEEVTISSYLISMLAENNIVLFSCDKTHMPNGAFFSFHSNSRFAEIVEAQIATTEPLKKRLWQEIIIQKIENQSAVLKHFNLSNANKLTELSKTVTSGDIVNTEGTAASIYWKSLFNNFIRHDDTDIRNIFLNYGYSILRGLIARNLTATGLLPVFGLHHKNMLNQFNLADDLIEPFRPFVDIEVKLIENETILTPQIKKQLISTITKSCMLNGEHHTIMKAAEITTASLSKSIKSKSTEYLKLPKII